MAARVSETIIPASAGHPELVLRRSSARRKTVSAKLRDGRIIVQLPATISQRQAQPIIDKLVSSLLAKTTTSESNLDDRAGVLIKRYFADLNPRPSAVVWVTNQNHRWGSCTPSTGKIRLSHRLQNMPDWVIDAILVHEIAHLIEPSHNREFKALVNRYPKMAEADLYLRGWTAGYRYRNPDDDLPEGIDGDVHR